MEASVLGQWSSLDQLLGVRRPGAALVAGSLGERCS